MKKPFSYEKAATHLIFLPESGLFRRTKYVQKGREITAGHADRRGYLRMHVFAVTVLAHRLAWLLFYKEWPPGEIDHVNGDKKDNRIENLRVCTHPQNNHNQPMRRSNTSGVKGVSWMKSCRKWHVQVCVNRKIHYGGLFVDIADAALAAQSLRERLHGEFANHG
jgi:hypothetical protein